MFFFANDYSDRELADVLGGWRGGRRKVSSCRNRGDKREAYAWVFFLRSKCGFVISVSLRLLALWNLPFQKRFAAPSKRSVLSFPSFADWEDEGRGGKQQKECDVQTISRENQWGYWKGYWKRRGGGVAQRGSVTLKEERKWQPGSRIL